MLWCTMYRKTKWKQIPMQKSKVAMLSDMMVGLYDFRFHLESTGVVQEDIPLGDRSCFIHHCIILPRCCLQEML